MRTSILFFLLVSSSCIIAQKPHDDYQGMGGFISEITEKQYKVTAKVERQPSIRKITFVQDKPVRMDVYEGSNEIAWQRFYAYSGRKLVQIKDVLPDSSLKQQTDYTYNEKGELITEVIFTPQFDITTTRSYTYNSQGKLSRRVFTSSAQGTSVTEIAYFPEHKVIEKNFQEDGTHSSTRTKINDQYDMRVLSEDLKFHDGNSFLDMLSVYEYDDHGNMTKTTIGNLIEIREYTYDSKGNWTKKVVYDKGNDNSRTVIERTITYST